MAIKCLIGFGYCDQKEQPVGGDICTAEYPERCKFSKATGSRAPSGQAEFALLAELATKARMGHYFCADCWYTCPKHEDGCCNDEAGDECNCGADDHNKKVDELYKKILAS